MVLVHVRVTNIFFNVLKVNSQVNVAHLVGRF